MSKINVLGGTSGGGGGGTDPSAAHTDEDETITGAWDFTIAPTVDGDPISGGGGDTFTPSYANALAGSRYTILYNGTAWPGSRPSARSDIYFDLIGGAEAVADPGWMLDGDAREIVPS